MALVLPRPSDVPPTQTWGIGYDGQQSYAIALDPAGPADGLDHPAYRYMRIVYPIVAWALALGQRAWVPWSMLVVNLLASGATAWLLAALCERRGSRAWAALGLILSFNYLIGIRLDLTEPLAFALAIAGICTFERGRLPMAIALFAAAGLTKEVALAFPIALAAWAGFSRKWREAITLAAGPLLAYLGWALLMALWIGASPFAEPRVPPTLPFSGLSYLEVPEARIMVTLWSVGPALLAGMAAAFQIARRPGGPEAGEPWMVVAWALVIATLPELVWVDPIAVVRVGAGLMIALILWLARSKPRWLPFAFALWAPSLLLFPLVPGLVR